MTDHEQAGTRPPTEEEERAYRLYRGQVSAEANWVINRTNWLLMANAFMATAFAVLATSAVDVPAGKTIMNFQGADVMLRGLPTAGLAVNIGTFLTLLAAEFVTLLSAWEFRKIREAFGEVHLPKLLGHGLAHFVGWLVPCVLAVGLAYGWMRVANP